MSKVDVSIDALKDRGIEVLSRGGSTVSMPQHSVLDVPSSLKWTQYEHSIHLGAFSYQVSGYCFAARIGRYCSFGEEVQIGRQNHPTTWVSTSPSFYLGNRVFGLEDSFRDGSKFKNYKFQFEEAPTKAKVTTIGHDVWIGHGAYIGAGVTIGHGAIIGAHSVVTRNVPHYAVVAGNPAVIKKMRLPADIISHVLQSQWWQFAPWQLDHLDPSKPVSFAKAVQKMHGDVEPFQPVRIDLRQEIPE